jgi:carboxylesterase
MPAVVTVAALGAAAGVRAAAKHAFEARVLARLPVGSDGVIPGAQSIDLPSSQAGSPAALLLHGFGDTPQTLTYLAADLHQRGWSVRAPLLPGHGRTIAEWAQTRADDWLACARDEFDALRRTHSAVALVGLSMGAALAALVAADIPAASSNGEGEAEPAEGVACCLALLAPYFALPAWIRLVAAGYPIVAGVMPYLSARGSFSILDPSERARSLAYGATTPRLVHELGKTAHAGWAALPGIRLPTVLVQSHADNRTTPTIAERALTRIGAVEKRLVWIDDGGHVITVDHGHAAVSACVGEWLDEHLPSRARARKVRPA